MDRLNELLQELGLSKVKLAKYLGVSRQMVYNYLVLDSLDKWPKEKKVLLLQLLDIKDGSKKSIDSIVVDTDYLLGVEKRLNTAIKQSNNIESFIDMNGLTKDNKQLLNDFVFLIKEKLEDNLPSESAAVRYMYYMLQSMDNVPEIKYIMGYMAKSNCFIKPEEYKSTYYYGSTTSVEPTRRHQKADYQFETTGNIEENKKQEITEQLNEYLKNK